MGTLTAGSPPSTTAALATVPHMVLPSPKATHSARVPEPDPTVVRGRVTSEEKSRKPELPVSMRMLLIVWQLDVPGTQTVTEPQGSFGYWLEPQSEPLTVTAIVFGPEAPTGLFELVDFE